MRDRDIWLARTQIALGQFARHLAGTPTRRERGRAFAWRHWAPAFSSLVREAEALPWTPNVARLMPRLMDAWLRAQRRSRADVRASN